MPPSSGSASPRRLVEILRALPQRELESLVSRLGIAIVAAKRLDPPNQVARALVSLPEIRDAARLPPASAQLLHRIAEARGTLLVQTLPPGLEPLISRGVVFAHAIEQPSPAKASSSKSSGGRGRSSAAGQMIVELVLPDAYMVQLRTWEGEDPRGIRALLAQASFETASAIATHYLGRPATPPIALSLEAAWEALSDPKRLADEVARLAPMEKRLLEALERQGGEVDTEELLDLEREPMRLRGAIGATPSRRGVGFALERRGFLIPVHPNRYIVPTEVAAIVGAARHQEREARRAKIRESIEAEDYLPRRARFADDPIPLTVALALAVREPGNEVRPAIGTPKSLIGKLAQRFGREPETVALIAALSRALGFWDPSALSGAAPPGSLRLHELGEALYSAWWRGGAWDEARPEPEVLRVQADARDPSPVGVLREMVIDALRELGEGRWVPWEALADYVRDDTRTAAVERLLRRWAERAGVEASTTTELVRRILLESLPALGVLDIGHDDNEEGASVRLTARGRAWVTERELTIDPTFSQFIDSQVLRIGSAARLSKILGLAQLTEIGKVGEQLDVLVTPPILSRALSVGVEAELIKNRIEAVAPLPDTLSRLIAKASVIVGRGSFVPAAGFLWIDDGNILEMLRTRKQTADLFVEPSPPSGLLIQPGVEFEKLVRRCRALGVEVVTEGQVVRARTAPSSSRRSSTTRSPVKDG